MPKRQKKKVDDTDCANDTKSNAIPLFTQGISHLLKCVSSLFPRMEWMSEIVIDQLENTLHSELLVDPLKRLPPKARETLLQLPEIAWPTIILFLADLLAICVFVCLSEFGFISFYAAGFFITMCMFLMFTVGHDAAHGSISSKNFKWINEVIGRLAFGIFGPLACFPVWRYIHQTHHRFTNHPEKDPDRFCCNGSWYLVPIRCLVLTPYYVYWYLWNAAAQRPILELLELVVYVATNLAIIAVGIEKGYTIQMLSYWIIPFTIAHAFLAFFFDFVPHHDHNATPIESRYHTTSILKTYPVLQPLLTLLLQYQDYHLIHHLYPTIPFYRYADKWQEKQDFLMEKNVKIQDFTVHPVH